MGKAGKPGEQVRCLISVNMLSEGWDARNVTQILGLARLPVPAAVRAGRRAGLRRSEMGDLTQPEFVDVYGVPFQSAEFRSRWRETAGSSAEDDSGTQSA